MVKNPWLGNTAGSESNRAGMEQDNIAPSDAASGNADKEQKKQSYAEQFLQKAAQAPVDDAPQPDEGINAKAQSPPGTSSSDAASAAKSSAQPNAIRPLLKQLEQKRGAVAMESLPRLSRKNQDRFSHNLHELSLIQGNLNAISRDASALYCTSCFAGEGKTVTALQIAYGLATYGKKHVLLTETNFDQPALASLFGTTNTSGLRDVLTSQASLYKSIVPTAYDGLYLLTAGQTGEWRSEAQMAQFLDEANANFDYVIIDGQSLLNYSEAVNLAPLVDGFILAVECERTKWEVVQIANRKLRGADAKHVGIVLNKRKYYVPRFIYRMISNT